MDQGAGFWREEMGRARQECRMKRQLSFTLGNRKEHENKGMSVQALDKGPGTEKRLGLEEACGEGSFHSQHHGHS